MKKKIILAIILVVVLLGAGFAYAYFATDAFKTDKELFFKYVGSDILENIADEDLRNKIVGQMLRCDEILTRIAENRFEEFFKKGYKNAKKE